MRAAARFGLAAVPALMLAGAAFLANRDQPRIAGLPFLLAWCVGWVLLTPLFLLGAERCRNKT
ncbi:MAG: DUF3311 domain-containing protein [Candidatus Eremiobacteraeota bacterium]|nr:DUF3311 domain-containing protein [Candidatus Eremiobacteraeota bacterium]